MIHIAQDADVAFGIMDQSQKWTVKDAQTVGYVSHGIDGIK